MRALLALCAFLLLAVPAGASNSQTFADSTGENPAAPDVTSIALSNDDAGLITFQINVSNRPALTQDMLFWVFLDTDGNPATGDTVADGADYLIQLIPGSVGLFHWNGSDFASTPSEATLVYSYASTGPGTQSSQPGRNTIARPTSMPPRSSTSSSRAATWESRSLPTTATSR